MFILEIALGIVLAVLILRCWPIILASAVWVLAAAIVFAVAIGLLATAYFGVGLLNESGQTKAANLAAFTGFAVVGAGIFAACAKAAGALGLFDLWNRKVVPVYRAVTANWFAHLTVAAVIFAWVILMPGLMKSPEWDWLYIASILATLLATITFITRHAGPYEARFQELQTRLLEKLKLREPSEHSGKQSTPERNDKSDT